MDNHFWGIDRIATQLATPKSQGPARMDRVHGYDACSSVIQGTTRCSRTVPFPLNSLWGTGTALHRRSTQALPTSGRAAKPAGSLQRLQHGAQPLVLDPE